MYPFMPIVGSYQPPVTITGTDFQSDETNATTYNFTVAIGTAFANRMVAVICYCDRNAVGSITAASFNGVSVLSDGIQVSASGTGQRLGMFWGRVATGTTMALSFTMSGACNRAGMAAFVLANVVSITPTDTDSSQANPLSFSSTTISAGGAALFAAQIQGTATFTWSDATEVYDNTLGSGGTQGTAATRTTAGTTTVTATPSAGSQFMGLGASWR